MTKQTPLLTSAIVLVAGNAISYAAVSAQEAVWTEGAATDDGTGEPVEDATVRLADSVELSEGARLRVVLSLRSKREVRRTRCSA